MSDSIPSRVNRGAYDRPFPGVGIEYDPLGVEPGIYRNSLALLQVVLSRPERDWQPPAPQNFDRVRRHIEASLATKLTAPLLARRVGLRIAGFNRGFRRCFGTAPAVYVTEMRGREAARLLLQTDKTIDAIAELTGFPNRADFSRVFKRKMDEAPAGFRRRHQRPAHGAAGDGSEP